MIENDGKVAKTEPDVDINKSLDSHQQHGVGLRGLTNSCSLNSILQVLFHINIFKHYVLYLRQSRVSISYVALELQKIFIQLSINENPPPSVKQLLFKLKIPPEELYKNNDPIFYLNRIYNILRNDYFFRDLFIGCVSKSNKNAYFLSLSLNVELGDDIETILHQMYSSMQFDRLPPIIFFNLDRFQDKGVNNKVVSFPEILDLSEYTIVDSNSNYELYSVIVHSGVDKNGHFFSYIFDMVYNEWVKYDDSKVKVVPNNIAIEENFGGNDKIYSAKVLVYFNISNKDILFEPDTEDYASSWISEKFLSKDGLNNMPFTYANNNESNKEYKINVVQVDDIFDYVDTELSIKFTSDRYISVYQKDTVKELYNKMAKFLGISDDKLTIWIIFRSVLSMKLLRVYDNQNLCNIIEPMKHVQFFVEEINDSEEEEEEELNSDENEDDAKPKSFNEENNKKIVIEKEKSPNYEENSILVFLFIYNYMNTIPLKFLGTVIIGFNENIQTLFNMAHSICGIESEMNMIAFQIIDSKCYLIADPLKTVENLELSDGSIIVVQPCSNLLKGNVGSRPKKPKSAHGIFTYCPDYISTLPHSFSVYYEYRKDPYILPLKLNNQRKMVQFPKGINCDDFRNFVLKAFNCELNPLTESILFYSKASTKPIDFVPSSTIGSQLNKLEIDEYLSQLYLIRININEVNDYYNMVRLRIKMISSTSRKGLTEFFYGQMNMLEVVNELKRRYSDLFEYFILPLNSQKEIIPENFVIENIRNPIYLNLRHQSDIYITMILIVNGKEIKELDIHVKGDDTFLDFKNKLNIFNTKEARFYTIGENGNQKNISDSQLMKKYGHFKAIIYFEAPFVPPLLNNMIARPLLNTVNMTYKSQILPENKGDEKSKGKESKLKNKNNDIKIKKEHGVIHTLFDTNDSDYAIDLVQSEYENDHLLINDQFSPDLVNSSEMSVVDHEMKEKLKGSRQFNKLFPMKEDIHLLYTDNVVPTFSKASQLKEVAYDKDELLKNYYFQPKVKRSITTSSNVTNSTNTDDEANNNNNSSSINQNEANQNDEKRGRGRPKRNELISKTMLNAEEEKNENEDNEIEDYKEEASKNSDENANYSDDDQESTENNKEDEDESLEKKKNTIKENENSDENENKKNHRVKKIQIEETKSDEEASNTNKHNTEMDEENYSKLAYNFKSDNEINYDDNDDDDDVIDYDLIIEDDDDYDMDDESDINDADYTRRPKKSKPRKKRKTNDDRNNILNNNAYLSGIQQIPIGSMNAIYRGSNNGNNNGGYYSNQLILTDPIQQQAAIAMRGNHHHIAGHIPGPIPTPVQSDVTTHHKGDIINIDENDPMYLIMNQNNPALLKIQHKQNENAPHSFKIPNSNNSDGSRNIEIGIPKVAMQVGQIPQQVSSKSYGYSNQQRREVINPMKHFHNMQEIPQQDHQQEQQQQRSLLQIQQNIKIANQQQQQQNHQQYPSDLIQPNMKIQNQQQQQQQISQYNYSKSISGSVINPLQPLLKNQSQQQQQSYQSLKQQQSSQYQSIKQQNQQQSSQIQPHPQPQIRTQQQQQQSNVHVYSYNRQIPDVQQINNNNEQNSKKKRPFHNSNHSKIDEIINLPNNQEDLMQVSDGRRKIINDNSNQNDQKVNIHSNLNKSRRVLDLNNRQNNSALKDEIPVNDNNSYSIYDTPIKPIPYQINTMKLEIANNVGFINGSSSDSTFSKIGNDFFSDTSSRLQFPRFPFTPNTFKLMPTNETELALNNQTDDKKQKDQNNRNRQNDPYMSQYTRFSDFSPSNDDFLHPL